MLGGVMDSLLSGEALRIVDDAKSGSPHPTERKNELTHSSTSSHKNDTLI